MKKVLPVLILISFLTVLAVPIAASAKGSKACCELRRDISWTSKLEAVNCTAAVPCTLKKGIAIGEVIGAGDCGEAVATTTKCAPSGPPFVQSTSCLAAQWGMICLLNTLYSITDWIFILLVALAVIFVVIGGFTLITAAGDATKVGTGKNYILYAVIGLVVAILARTIPTIVRTIVGV